MLLNNTAATKLFFVALLVITGLLFSSVMTSHEFEARRTDLDVAGSVQEACNVKGELQMLLDLHNQSRSEGFSCKTSETITSPPLVWNCHLVSAAEKHANDMHSNDFLSHKGSDDRVMESRATSAGYQWRNIGENVAQGYESVDNVYQSWLESEGHCENIRNLSYREFGAAKVGLTWVVMFGRQ